MYCSGSAKHLYIQIATSPRRCTHRSTAYLFLMRLQALASFALLLLVAGLFTWRHKRVVSTSARIVAWSAGIRREVALDLSSHGGVKFSEVADALGVFNRSVANHDSTTDLQRLFYSFEVVTLRLVCRGEMPRGAFNRRCAFVTQAGMNSGNGFVPAGTTPQATCQVASASPPWP